MDVGFDSVALKYLISGSRSLGSGAQGDIRKTPQVATCSAIFSPKSKEAML